MLPVTRFPVLSTGNTFLHASSGHLFRAFFAAFSWSFHARLLLATCFAPLLPVTRSPALVAGCFRRVCYCGYTFSLVCYWSHVSGPFVGYTVTFSRACSWLFRRSCYWSHVSRPFCRLHVLRRLLLVTRFAPFSQLHVPPRLLLVTCFVPFLQLHVSPRLLLVTCFAPFLPVTRSTSLVTSHVSRPFSSYTFPLACYWSHVSRPFCRLHVLPCLLLVTCFAPFLPVTRSPALVTGCFVRVGYWSNVFPPLLCFSFSFEFCLANYTLVVAMIGFVITDNLCFRIGFLRLL